MYAKQKIQLTRTKYPPPLQECKIPNYSILQGITIKLLLMQNTKRVAFLTVHFMFRNIPNDISKVQTSFLSCLERI